MALINIYNGLNKESEKIIYTGKIRDGVKIDFNNAIILKGGERITPDYCATENDIIYIRRLPADPVTVALVVGATALVAGGVSLGVSLYNKKQAEQQMQAAQKASKAAADTSNKLPYIRGAENQTATGNGFAFILGKTLFTPRVLAPVFFTFEGDHGEKQYYNTVLELGYNNLHVDEIKLGETIIKSFTGSAAQSGVFTFDAGLYYDESNIIEIRQSGDFTTADFNKKIIQTTLNKEIPHRHATDDAAENEEIETEWRAGIVQELPANTKAVELIALFDGLQKYTDSGWDNELITLQPQWTNANNPGENDWHDFTNGFNQNGTYNNTFTYNTKKQMRFIARQNFTAAQAYNKNIKVRIKRTTPKEESTAKDTVYLIAVKSECYDAKKSTSSTLTAAAVFEPRERDKCCRLGLRIAANTNTEGFFKKISVIETACARTWNGSAWTNAKTPTRNLAAWALELLTSPHHDASCYDDSELDLESFGEWYEYCEAQGFNADGAIINGAKKKTTLDTLCANSNAALFYNSFTGKIEVAIDNGRENSIALLNSENIISISQSKKLERKTDGRKVTYINGAAGYDADSVVFMRDGGAYDPATDTLTQNALQFVTDYAHAFKIAWRQMAEELAQPRIITVKAGLESAYYPLYSRVELQHRTLKNGLAHGVIKELHWHNHLLDKIVLDGFVTFPDAACGVLINCVSSTGRGILPLKVTNGGTAAKTNILKVTTTLRDSAALLPTAGNILSFGELDSSGEFTTVTSTMKITNAEESDGAYILTLVDYNPAVYTYGTLPAYKSNLTPPPNGRSVSIEEQREYIERGESEADASAAATAAVNVTTRGINFSNKYKIKQPTETLEDIVARMDEDARNASASMSILDDEIILKVEDTEKNLRAVIDVTAGEIYQTVEDGDNETRGLIDTTAAEILAQVDDMAQELTGLIDVQAGAVSAMVAGGGAAGALSLSINLPAMINATQRAQLVAASTEAKVAAVYAQLEDNPAYYAIKNTVTNTQIKTLWDDACSAGLLASQIILSGNQINIAGKTIYTSSKVDTVEETANTANTKAGNAQTAAANAQSAADDAAAAAAAASAKADTNRNDVAVKLGYASWEAMEAAAQASQTIIDGGYIRTNLIDLLTLFAKQIVLKNNGFIRSDNYVENYRGFKLDNNTGTIEAERGKFNGAIQNGLIDAIGGQLEPFSYTGIVSQANFLGQSSDWVYVPAAENPYGTGATRKRTWQPNCYDENKRDISHIYDYYEEYDINDLNYTIPLDNDRTAVTKITNITFNGYFGSVNGTFKLHNIPDERLGDNIDDLEPDEIYADTNGVLKRKL